METVVEKKAKKVTKKHFKTFGIEYTQTVSVYREIEAEDEDEALDKMQEMIESEEIDVAEEGELCDCKYECVD